MLPRPLALRKVASCLIGSDEILHRRQAYEAFALGDDRSGRAKHGPRILFVVAHGEQPLWGRAEALDLVVASGLQPAQEKNLLDLQGIRGVRRINDERLAA